ncbi:MAG: hypothetical protein ABIO04_14550 [Ferruginibacter sp.]
MRVRFIGHAISGRNCWSGDQYWRDIIVGRRPTMAAVTDKGGILLLVGRPTLAAGTDKGGNSLLVSDQQRRDG